MSHGHRGEISVQIGRMGDGFNHRHPSTADARVEGDEDSGRNCRGANRICPGLKRALDVLPNSNAPSDVPRSD